MNHNDFHENLESAQRGEEHVVALLCSRFKDFNFVGYNNDKKCDIVAKIGTQTVSIEVKEDTRVAATCNVVIECQSWGKPSGIATTTSDFWIFRLHLKEGISHWIYRTSTIKNAIIDNVYDRRRKMTHTDSKNVLYFFKLDKFLPLSLLKLD